MYFDDDGFGDGFDIWKGINQTLRNITGGIPIYGPIIGAASGVADVGADVLKAGTDRTPQPITTRPMERKPMATLTNAQLLEALKRPDVQAFMGQAAKPMPGSNLEKAMNREAMMKWLIPVAVGGGILVLLLAMKKKK